MPANLSESAEQLPVGACGLLMKASRRPQWQCQLADQAF
jgi:hypothetical protein